MPVWLADDLKNKNRLSPKKFVQWAIKHPPVKHPFPFSCLPFPPWLPYADEHFPRLLPKNRRKPKPEDENQHKQPPEPEDKDQSDHASSIMLRKSGRPPESGLDKAEKYYLEHEEKGTYRSKNECMREGIEFGFPEAGKDEGLMGKKFESLKKRLQRRRDKGDK